MFEMFQYDFMVRAFIVGSLLAVILPCMGLPILLKRLSMIGDTLSHSSLAGLTIGLAFGIHPILSAILACIFAGLGIELIREKLKSYEEISVVIIMAASVGLAGIFTSFVQGGQTISSYLFGSIVTITDSEFYMVIGISLLVIVIYTKIYNILYLSVFDERNARFLGINSKAVNFMLTFLSAVTISISAKTIGALIVSSLLVIPVIAAMQYVKSYRNVLLLSIGFSVVFVYLGLFMSYEMNLKPGSVIVLLSVFWLLISLFIRRRRV